jgi:hypothetical protein
VPASVGSPISSVRRRRDEIARAQEIGVSRTSEASGGLE